MKTIKHSQIALATALFATLAAIPAYGQQWYQQPANAQYQTQYAQQQQPASGYSQSFMGQSYYYQIPQQSRQSAPQQARPQTSPAQYSSQQTVSAPASQAAPRAAQHLSSKKAATTPVNAPSYKKTAAPAQPETYRDNTWMTSFDAAWSRAYRQGRPLVVLIVHQGCPACAEMDGVLAQPGAMNTLASAVKVRLEFTDNPGIISRYGVKFTPTFLVLGPDGSEAYREVGALSLDRLRAIQPSLESLVTVPPSNSKKRVSLNDSEKLEPSAKDEATSKTVASL